MIVNLIQQHADQIARVGLHFLWQGTVIAVVATLAGRFFLKSPNQKSAVYLASLVALALCVPVTMALVSEPSAVAQNLSVAPPASEITGAQPTLHGEAIPTTLPPEEKTPLTVWLVGLYLLGLTLMMTRVVRGFLWSNRTRRQGTFVSQPEWTTALAQALTRIKLRNPPVMFWSENVSSPVVTGILRPMIILPISLMSGLPREQAIAVLSHELAHLRRYDHIIVVFQRLLEALFFFHPAVWFLSRRLDQEREKACDDLVLNTGSNRADYAEALVSIASDQKPSFALSAAGNKQLTERVLRILNHRQPTTVRVNRGGWLTIAAAITLLGVFSFSPAQSQEKEHEEQGKPAGKVEETALMKSLQINLPEMSLHNVTLVEAMEFLRHRSIELDPEGQGINIVLRDVAGKKIIDNLVLRNVTFQQAFKAICLKTGTQFTVEKFAVTVTPRQEDQKAPAEKIPEPTLMKKLQIKLPEMKLRNATLQESVEFLRLRSTELDPEPDPKKKGLNIVIRQSKEGEKNEDKIIDSLDFRDITLQQAFQAICLKTGTQYKVDEFAVTILPKQKPADNNPGMVQRSWVVSPDFLKAITPGIKNPKTENLVDYLKKFGITFPKGSAWSYVPDRNSLIVRNTPTNLDFIDQLLQPVIEPKEPKGNRKRVGIVPNKDLDEIRKIIIPRASFENTTLEEAIDFMRLRALELDPAKKGVNINFFGDKETPDLVNLDLRNVPLPVLLSYVCNLTKTRYTIEGRNISILPANK